MNELTLTELDMGIAVPKILQAFKPSVDHRGKTHAATSGFDGLIPLYLWRTEF